MPAYDNPVRNIRTRKLAEAETGENLAIQWAIVKGKCIGTGGVNQEVEFTTFTKLEITNLNQIKAGAGALEVVVGF